MTLRPLRHVVCLLGLSLIVSGCGESAPAPVPQGSLARDWYAIAESAPAGFVLTDAMPQRPRPNKDQSPSADDLPLTNCRRECPEQPGVTANQPFESVVDPRPAPSAKGGDELLAWASFGTLPILIRWSLRDGKLLNFMPVPGSVGEGLRGVRWLRPPFALIGDRVADLTAQRFVGKIDARPKQVRQILNGPDGRNWIHTNLNRLVPVDLPDEDWLVRATGGAIAPLPLGPLAKVKLNIQIPIKPSGVPDFETELVTALASHLKSWGTQIASDAAAQLAVELNFNATGQSVVVQTFKRDFMGKQQGPPTGSVKLPEYLLTGTIRLETERPPNHIRSLRFDRPRPRNPFFGRRTRLGRGFGRRNGPPLERVATSAQSQRERLHSVIRVRSLDWF